MCAGLAILYAAHTDKTNRVLVRSVLESVRCHQYQKQLRRLYRSHAESEVSVLKGRDWQPLDRKDQLACRGTSRSGLFPRDVTARAAILYLKSGKTNNISLLIWVR